MFIYRSFSTVESVLDIQAENDQNIEAVQDETSNNTNNNKTVKSKKTAKKNSIPTTNIAAFNQHDSLLYSLMDRKKWRKRLNLIKVQSKSNTINLVKLLTLRNNCHRVPCQEPDTAIYNTFRSLFKFSPTTDQLNCFQDINNDLIKSSKPMDRLVCG